MDFFLKNFLESAFPWAYANLQTTLIYAHADTEQKRKAIELAEHSGSPTRKKHQLTDIPSVMRKP